MTDRMDFLSSSLERQTCKLSLKLLRSGWEQLHRQQQVFLRPARMVLIAGSSESATAEGPCRGMGAGATGATVSGLGS